MNFKKKVSGSWTDTPHYIHNTSTDTITTLPAVIHPTGTTATVGLKGNTLQSSIPSPTSPVMPQGTGERTGNLYSGTDVSGSINNAYYKNDFVYANLSQGIYTLAFDLETTATSAYRSSIGVGATTYSKDIQVQTGKTDGHFVFTFTISEEDAGKNLYARFARFSTEVTITYTASNIMLNEGSTALPYEPYGYKIPISINNVVTDIYIGDNPLRKSLDGTAYDTLAADGTLTRRVDSDGSVLPTPIVTQVTMPTFTTTPGANTLNVLTTVPPSEVTATFDGWHPVSAAHERENGAWT